MDTKKYLRGILVISFSAMALTPVASVNGRQLVPVSPSEGRSVVKDLASRTTGTLLFRSTSDGAWKPVSDASETTEVDNLQSPVPTAKVDLSPGAHNFLFAFNDVERVDRLAFRRQGGEGKVRVYAANAPYPLDSPRWQILKDAKVEADESLVDLNFPLTSTSHIRVSLDFPEGGEMSPLFLSSDMPEENGSAPVPPPEQWSDSSDYAAFDFARLASGGRITYIGSGRGEEAQRMVDRDPATFFDFGTNEGEAFFLATLSEAYPVHQASITTMEAIGGVELWALESYPRELLSDAPEGPSRGTLELTPEFLSQRAQTGKVIVPEDEEVTSLNIPLPDTTARYLLVRVIGKDPDRPVQVNLFSVVGRVPREYLGNRAARRSRSELVEPTPEPPPQKDLPRIPPRIPIASP